MPEFYALTKIVCEEKHCGDCKFQYGDGKPPTWKCDIHEDAGIVDDIRCQACLDAQKVVEARLLDQHIDHLNYFSEAWKELGTSDLSKFARNWLKG